MAGSAYDMIISGGGPAGLTVGLYAGRARFKILLLEKLITGGGQIMTTDLVDHDPGFFDGTTGCKLSQGMRSQAERCAASKAVMPKVTELKPGPPSFHF